MTEGRPGIPTHGLEGVTRPGPQEDHKDISAQSRDSTHASIHATARRGQEKTEDYQPWKQVLAKVSTLWPTVGFCLPVRPFHELVGGDPVVHCRVFFFLEKKGKERQPSRRLLPSRPPQGVNLLCREGNSLLGHWKPWPRTVFPLFWAEMASNVRTRLCLQKISCLLFSINSING